MKTTSRSVVLVVEDDDSLRRIAEFNLKAAGSEAYVAADGDEGIALYKELKPDLTVADIVMPKRDGLSMLKEIRRLDPDALVIMITAHGTVERAVEAMKGGAFDFVTKPISWEEMNVVIEKAIEHRRLATDNARLRAELNDRYQPENMIGASAAMQDVFRMVHRVASSDSNILILGESGTGKEVIARAIHAASPRSAGSFVAVNCGTLPRDLIESELFGYQRGAFTGAHRTRIGKFEQADGGTIFLDEVAELPVDLQVKLLRVIQERQVERLGAQEVIPINVRILAATNADVRTAMQEGRLREDLYFRLNVVTIAVPPLRDRREDIPPLVEHFLSRKGEASSQRVRITDDAMDTLMKHSWPGNVRELENAIERALVLRQNADRIDLEDLPPEICRGRVDGDSQFQIPPDGLDMEEIERDFIRQALERTAGNQSRAARLLGMTRQTLLYRMRKHGLGK